MTENRKKRVFVVQRPAFYDKTKREFVDKYDLSPAAKHGELTFILGPGNVFREDLPRAVVIMRQTLESYDPEGDCLLAVGDPVAIAMAALVAGERAGGRVRLLKWDRLSGEYESYEVEAWGKVS